MSFFNRYLLILLLIFSSSSCAITKSIDSLSHDSEYKAGNDMALVAVGQSGRYETKRLRQFDPSSFNYNLVGYGLSAYLIPVSIGQTFKIDKITVGDSRIVHLDEYALLHDAKNLQIKQHGIYYYGTLHYTGKKVSLSYNLSDRIKAAIKYTYPKQVESMPAINFEW